MNLLINLISDQTIPNIQFIKEFRKSADELLFITTETMEEKGVSEWILKTLNIKNQYTHRLVVSPFSFSDIRVKLNGFDYEKYDQILVNLTGGTKIMSLISFDFFKNKGAEIYYLTGKQGQYFKIFPEKKKNEFQLQHHISLREYLTAYGFKVRETKPSGIPFHYTQRFFKWFTEDKTEGHYRIISKLQNFRRKGCEITDVEGLGNLLNEIGFLYKDNKLTKYQIKYLTGEWFEEYIYYIVKKELNLGDDLKTGIVLTKNEVQNEYDVVFLYKEQLHLIECKTYILSDIKKSLVNDTIYKSSSLLKQMGLFAQSYIFTLNKEMDLRKASFDRADELRIKIIGLENLQTEEDIKKAILD